MAGKTETKTVSGISERRLHRIEERREQILTAASKIFAEKGYQRATTREIAEEADLSEGLIYSYFESKDHLLLAILEKLASSGFNEMSPVEENESFNHDILNKTFEIRHGFLDEMDSMMRATMGEAITNGHFREHYFNDLVKPALETMETQINNWIASGNIEKTDAQAASRFLLAEIIGLFYLRAVDDPYLNKNWNDSKFMKQISDYFVNGLK